MREPFLCDERIGCVAVYRGPKRNCLCGITRDPECVFYRGGSYDADDGWVIEQEDVEKARIIARAINKHEEQTGCQLASELEGKEK